jgi:hypothetical protein
MVMAGRTMCFPGMVVMARWRGPGGDDGDSGGGVGKVTTWSRRRRRSGTAQFSGAAMKAGWTARFPGIVMV